MLGLVPTRKQWKAWSLPSKLTAIGTLIAVLSFVLYLFEKGDSFISESSLFKNKDDVFLVVELVNHSDDMVSLFSRGETFFWYPGGGQYISYAFEVVKNNSNETNSSNINIPGKDKLRVVVKLLPKDVVRGYLEQGHMSISLIFRNTAGKLKFSPTVGFSESNIKGAYIPIVFNEEES